MGTAGSVTASYCLLLGNNERGNHQHKRWGSVVMETGDFQPENRSWLPIDSRQMLPSS